MVKSVAGLGQPETLYKSPKPTVCGVWSRDGKWLFCSELKTGTKNLVSSNFALAIGGVFSERRLQVADLKRVESPILWCELARRRPSVPGDDHNRGAGNSGREHCHQLDGAAARAAVTQG